MCKSLEAIIGCVCRRRREGSEEPGDRWGLEGSELGDKEFRQELGRHKEIYREHFVSLA